MAKAKKLISIYCWKVDRWYSR